jgi:hypothetical protein
MAMRCERRYSKVEAQSTDERRQRYEDPLLLIARLRVKASLESIFEWKPCGGDAIRQCGVKRTVSHGVRSRSISSCRSDRGRGLFLSLHTIRVGRPSLVKEGEILSAVRAMTEASA